MLMTYNWTTLECEIVKTTTREIFDSTGEKVIAIETIVDFFTINKESKDG